MATALNNATRREIAILWSVKSYHIFKVRPYPEIPLLIVPDPENMFDKDAMNVMMPENVNPEYLHKVTREGDSKREPQRVREILGKQVGCVPANLSKVFST